MGEPVDGQLQHVVGERTVEFRDTFEEEVRQRHRRRSTVPMTTVPRDHCLVDGDAHDVEDRGPLNDRRTRLALQPHEVGLHQHRTGENASATPPSTDRTRNDARPSA